MRALTAKQQAKATDARIDAAYNRLCCGIEIPMMSIPQIFTIGRRAIASGADDEALGAEILSFVNTIRTKP